MANSFFAVHEKAFPAWAWTPRMPSALAALTSDFLAPWANVMLLKSQAPSAGSLKVKVSAMFGAKERVTPD